MSFIMQILLISFRDKYRRNIDDVLKNETTQAIT